MEIVGQAPGCIYGAAALRSSWMEGATIALPAADFWKQSGENHAGCTRPVNTLTTHEDGEYNKNESC